MPVFSRKLFEFVVEHLNQFYDLFVAHHPCLRELDLVYASQAGIVLELILISAHKFIDPHSNVLHFTRLLPESTQNFVVINFLPSTAFKLFELFMCHRFAFLTSCKLSVNVFLLLNQILVSIFLALFEVVRLLFCQDLTL